MGEADALTIRFNAMNEAWGYRTQAVNSRNNARMARFGGKQASRNTYLTTAASLAGQAYGGYQSGAFSGGGGSATTGGPGGHALRYRRIRRWPDPPPPPAPRSGHPPPTPAPVAHTSASRTPPPPR